MDPADHANPANQTDHAGHAPTTASIAEVSVAAPVTRAVSVAIGLSIVVMLTVVMVVGIGLGLTSGLTWVVILGTLAVLAGWRLISHRVATRRVDRLLATEAPADISQQAEAILRRTRYVQPMAALHHWVELLAAGQHTAAVLRICQPEQRASLTPINVPFEPQLLDETDPILEQLSEGAAADAGPDRKPTDPTWQYVVRNVHMKGGWFVVAAFGFNVVIHGLMAIRTGRITWQLAMWSSMFAATLLIPVGSAGTSRRQALAVPGGLLVRKAGKRRSGWDLHLFTRERAVLMVYQAGRKQWMIVTADGERRERVAGTRREVEFALWAWLSPLPPPDAARLSDLA